MQQFPFTRKPRNAEPRLFQILGHVSLKSNGSSCVEKSRIAISLCKSFATPETLISRTLTLWDLSPRVLAVWTARILSGNCRSRFQNARVSCPDSPIPDSSGYLATCPCGDQRLKFSIGVSRLKRSQFSRLVKTRCLQNPDEFPDY
jgi:hypothetical protein